MGPWVQFPVPQKKNGICFPFYGSRDKSHNRNMLSHWDTLPAPIRHFQTAIFQNLNVLFSTMISEGKQIVPQVQGTFLRPKTIRSFQSSDMPVTLPSTYWLVRNWMNTYRWSWVARVSLLSNYPWRSGISLEEVEDGTFLAPEGGRVVGGIHSNFLLWEVSHFNRTYCLQTSGVMDKWPQRASLSLHNLHSGRLG